MNFLKPYRCSHCNKRIVIMETYSHSVLPVEIPDGRLIYTDDDTFESSKHKSHLLNCEKLRAEWNKKKKWFLKDLDLSLKDLTR